jgi:hypothetical protein
MLQAAKAGVLSFYPTGTMTTMPTGAKPIAGVDVASSPDYSAVSVVSKKALSGILEEAENDLDLPPLPPKYEWKIDPNNGVLFILTDAGDLILPYQMFDLVTIREQIENERETGASKMDLHAAEKIIEKLEVVFARQEKILRGISYNYKVFRGGGQEQ